MPDQAPTTVVPIHRGVTFGFYARNGYFETDAARTEVDRMADINVRWVCLVATVMQESATSPRQFRDFENTPSDYELLEIIDYIHGKGMKVHLRPMIECFDGHGRTQVWFPHDAERIPGRHSTAMGQWFAGMRARTRHYARLAQKAGCAMYGLDSELDRFVHMSREWRQVVAVAREHFHGPVTSCHTHMVNFITELEKPDHWFRDLDVLGTSFYHPSAAAHGASMDSRVAFLKPKVELYRQMAQLLGKPIMFGECGCTSSHAGAAHPSAWRGEGGYEPTEQADHLEAVLRSFWSEPWWAGLYWWKWDEQNDRPQFKDDPRGDKGFTIVGKPAAEVMKRWSGRTDRS
ncbi:MAG: hypothetical protein WD042_01850 [Phycisphaeraceae bacterium]